MTAAEWTITAIVILAPVVIAWAAPRAYRDLRDVWRSRRPLPSWQQLAAESPPVSSPAHDTIQLRDGEKDAFDGLMAGYFQPEDAS